MAGVHAELDRAIEAHFPDALPKENEERKAGEEKDGWKKVDQERHLVAPRTGYLQAIDLEGLVESARELDLRVRVLRRPGHFVNKGSSLFALSGELREEPARLTGHVIIGSMRSAEQDFEFCLRQLVEIALRALSPGINDPFTAVICVDYLGAAIAKVSQRRLPRRIFYDKEDLPRVCVSPVLFRDLLNAAFHQIRQASIGKPDLSIRLLEALARIGSLVVVEEHREAVLEQAQAVVTAATERADVECDRADLEEAHQRVEECCAR